MKDTERSANLKWMKFPKTAKHQSAFRVCDVSECYSSVTCSKNCSVWNSSVSTYWHSETISFMHLWPVSLISALIHAGAKIIYIYTVYYKSPAPNVASLPSTVTNSNTVKRYSPARCTSGALSPASDIINEHHVARINTKTMLEHQVWSQTRWISNII